jgi:hypothetical protein
MMKVFEIDPGYQRHFVVAESFSDAERLYIARYKSRPTTIKLVGDYVLVQGIDDKEQEARDE